ncbi:MAG: hypothetical protein DMG65_01405 [Candidatus Angelobacter sp. Gp1-AA117]|nr:MAG: hypothetical protein DMG65_01405 [Candidatus Angelobacter sp. Gp1-AA117]
MAKRHNETHVLHMMQPPQRVNHTSRERTYLKKMQRCAKLEFVNREKRQTGLIAVTLEIS